MARRAVLEAGPTGRNPKRVAAELRTLAADARLAVHRQALEELAEDLLLPQRLARWADMDLVAAYAARDMFLPSYAAEGRSWKATSLLTDRRQRWRDRLERLTHALAESGGALVFVPLLVTWMGLGAAAWAYQSMRAEGKGDGETFLALWQQGFAGHLPLPFHFDFLVAYTVAALCCLVLATVLRHRHERAEDAAARILAARLAGVLAQVQAGASEAAHATPLRFAEELRGAAQNLRALGELASRAQQETNGLIAGASRTSALTQAAADSLGQGMRELRTAAETVASSTHSVSQAAQEARIGAQVLSGEVGKLLDGMDQGVRRAAGTAAEQLAGAAADAVRRISEAADAAAEREETAARRNADLLHRTTEGMDSAFTSARTSLESATGELAGAVQRLDGTVTGLPHALEASAADGAERIGWAYDQAVVALAATLREDLRTVSGELAGHVAHLRELSRLREAAERAAEQRGAHTEHELRSSVEEFRATLREVADLVRDTTDAFVRARPSPATAAEPPQVSVNGFDHVDRWTGPGRGRPDTGAVDAVGPADETEGEPGPDTADSGAPADGAEAGEAEEVADLGSDDSDASDGSVDSVDYVETTDVPAGHVDLRTGSADTWADATAMGGQPAPIAGTGEEWR